ncbi:MAG: HEAT repeat domain-containing protein [Candidatus Aminicenantes bacterium]|nr:HEAT repeat domain-containing protein [Candidatus Aminicenantes bacterium]
MSSKHIKTQIPDYLTGELEANERETFKNHIASCSACREELENLNEIWIKLGVLPEQQPVKQLRTQFYSMLSDYKEGLDTEKQPKSRINLITRIYRSLAVRRPLLQFTYSLVFIVTGFFAGYILFSPQVLKTELKVLENEIQNIRQQAAISMLNQSSASDRLNGVTWSARVKSPSNNTLVTLLQTLNNDPNVNVRLAVVDALYLFSDHPLVKQGIIQSLARQNSPLVQSGLINLISELREKRAIKALKQLIQRNRLEPEIRNQAELSLKQIARLDKAGAKI